MKLRALSPEWGITVVRMMAGLIIFVAALEKFAAGGFAAFTRVVAGLAIPLPELFGTFIPLLELIGGALLFLGLGARWVAVLFVVEFIVTTFALKTPRQPPFGGWDSLRIDLMLLAASIALVLCGPGALALEGWLRRALARGSSASAAGQGV